MDYNGIIMELFDRIKVLEEKVARLERKEAEAPVPPAVPASQPNVNGKYKQLSDYLLTCGLDSVTKTYEELEGILGFELPATAHNFMASYWANTYTHSYAASWLSVGYKARVNFNDKTVTFEKTNS